MAKSKVSLGDIAKELNISKTTISFILNGRAKEKRISDELVKKVLKVVDEMNYRPNHFAQSLRTGRTNIIGLMVEDISNPFFGAIAKKIEEKAHKNGYKIVYCSTENDLNRARDFVEMFITLGVDGCIIAPTVGLEDDIRKLVSEGVEVVLFDRRFQNLFADSVMIDNREGSYKAVEHLVSQGHKKIAFVALVLEEINKEERIRGYLEAMADFKLEPHLFPFSFTLDNADYVKGIRKILEEHTHLDAVIFGTNYLGISGLEAINELDLVIPENLAMVSFDDHDLFRIHKPGITVIAQPIEEIAQTTIDLLLRRLKNQGNNKSRTESVLSTTLVQRASSARLHESNLSK